MHGKFRLPSPGKARSHSMQFLVVVFSMCAVVSCFQSTGCDAYSFTTDGYRIFNVRTTLGVCHTHEGGVRHKQFCIRVDSEGQKNCSSPCPTRGSNPRSSDLNSDALTTDLVPLCCINFTVQKDKYLKKKKSLSINSKNR